MRLLAHRSPASTAGDSFAPLPCDVTMPADARKSMSSRRNSLSDLFSWRRTGGQPRVSTDHQQQGHVAPQAGRNSSFGSSAGAHPSTVEKRGAFWNADALLDSAQWDPEGASGEVAAARAALAADDTSPLREPYLLTASVYDGSPSASFTGALTPPSPATPQPAPRQPGSSSRQAQPQPATLGSHPLGGQTAPFQPSATEDGPLWLGVRRQRSGSTQGASDVAPRKLVKAIYMRAREARSNREQCLAIARFANKLGFIFREIEMASEDAAGSGAGASGTGTGDGFLSGGHVAQLASKFMTTLRGAHALVHWAASMGRCRLVLEGARIGAEFQAISAHLADVMALVLHCNLSLPPDVGEDVQHVYSQLWRLHAQVAQQHWALAGRLRQHAAGLRGGCAACLAQAPPPPPLQELVQQVLEAAGLGQCVSRNERLAAAEGELADLRGAAAAAQAEGLADDQLLWEQVLRCLEWQLFPERRNTGWGNPPQQDAGLPDPPEEFRCPISLELMSDPVIMVETAMTYDRRSIEQHFARGHDNCPLSGRLLSHKRMIANYTVKAAVDKWVRQRLVERSNMTGKGAGHDMANPACGRALRVLQSRTTEATDEQPLEQASSEAVAEVPSDVSGAIAALCEALTARQWRHTEACARRLCAVADLDEASRVRIAAEGGIAPLVTLLKCDSNACRTAAARAVWYLARSDSNTAAIVEASALLPLVQLLWGGSEEARESAARAFWNLSTYNDHNKVLIAREGAVPPLVHLLAFGEPAGKEAAAGALRSLAVNDDNEVDIIRAGAVPPLVELAKSGDDNCKEVAIGALRNLCSRLEWQVEIVSAGGVDALQELVASGAARAEVLAQARSLLKRFNALPA